MTSLLRQGLYTISFDLSVAVRFGVNIGVADRQSMGNPCVNNYCDRDGKWFWIVGLEGDRHWPPLAAPSPPLVDRRSASRRSSAVRRTQPR